MQKWRIERIATTYRGHGYELFLKFEPVADAGAADEYLSDVKATLDGENVDLIAPSGWPHEDPESAMRTLIDFLES